MNRIFLFMIALMAFIWGDISLSCAFDDATTKIANKVIFQIFDDLIVAETSFPDLAQLGEKALSKNKYGVYQIDYRFVDPKKISKLPLEIHIDIVGMDDEYAFLDEGFKDEHLGFPLLGLRISSYLKRPNRMARFALSKIIKKHSQLLYDHQQGYLPLKLTLKPEKEVFKVDADIKFEVVLENVGEQSLQVKELGEQSLFFSIEERVWGTNPNTYVSKGEDVILDPGDSIKRSFVGENFKRPKEVEIICTYNLGYKGVLPSDSIKIKIVEEPTANTSK